MRSREQMNPNSRSPWADWLRFMKSMSIDDQGMSRLNWVCRWQSGLLSRVRPPIHILDGLNVCIHATIPMQFGAASASRSMAVISSGVVTTGLKTSLTGRPGLGVEALDDLPGVGLDLLQRLGTVEVLAAGDEPDFEAGKVDHVALDEGIAGGRAVNDMLRLSHNAFCRS